MIRRMFAAIGLILTLAALAGCGGDGNVASQTANPVGDTKASPQVAQGIATEVGGASTEGPAFSSADATAQAAELDGALDPGPLPTLQPVGTPTVDFATWATAEAETMPSGEVPTPLVYPSSTPTPHAADRAATVTAYALPFDGYDLTVSPTYAVGGLLDQAERNIGTLTTVQYKAFLRYLWGHQLYNEPVYLLDVMQSNGQDWFNDSNPWAKDPKDGGLRIPRSFAYVLRVRNKPDRGEYSVEVYMGVPENIAGSLAKGQQLFITGEIVGIGSNAGFVTDSHILQIGVIFNAGQP